MIELLLAEVLSPSVHPGEIRFPAKQKEGDEKGIRIEDGQINGEENTNRQEAGKEVQMKGKVTYRGDVVYGEKRLRAIELECQIEEMNIESYRRCAVLLTASYTKEGYINTKAYAVRGDNGPYILVIAGKIAEVQVRSGKPNIDSIVERYARILKGEVLNVKVLDRYLKAIKGRVPGISRINARLMRLGSDSSKTRLVLDIGLVATKVSGTIEVGNDGALNGGEVDAQLVLYKNSSFKAGDSILIYNEEFIDGSASVGQAVTSMSYRYPVTNRVSVLTGASLTNNFEPNTEVSWDDFSSRQLQYTVGIDVGLSDNVLNEVNASASFVGQSGDLYYQGSELPDTVPDIVRRQKSGYLQLSMGQLTALEKVSLSNKVYFIKAIAEYTPNKQLDELAQVNIDVNEANAVGGFIGINQRVNKIMNNSFEFFGQYALNNLTPVMRFSVGSGIGFKGLPDQFVSGDSGWAVIAKSAIRVKEVKHGDIYIKPYIGYGYVHSRLNSISIDDYVGSYGLTMEVKTKSGISLELGYLKSILRNELKNAWSDWVLGNGVYGRIKYRF